MGGIVGGWIGVILGGTIRHTVGGHMGGKSMLLLHSGCITPLTHRQTHAAFALLALTDAPTSAAHNNNFRMGFLPVEDAPDYTTNGTVFPITLARAFLIMKMRCTIPP